MMILHFQISRFDYAGRRAPVFLSTTVHGHVTLTLRYRLLDPLAPPLIGDVDPAPRVNLKTQEKTWIMVSNGLLVLPVYLITIAVILLPVQAVAAAVT